MAILIPKILRYSFIQAPNHQCGDWALADWSPVLSQRKQLSGIRDKGFGMEMVAHKVAKLCQKVAKCCKTLQNLYKMLSNVAKDGKKIHKKV